MQNCGHREGAKTLEKIVRYANKIGLKYLTVYAFSTENWKRAEEEVKTLMTLFQSYLDDYSKRADSENIKVKILGEDDQADEMHPAVDPVDSSLTSESEE